MAICKKCGGAGYRGGLVRPPRRCSYCGGRGLERAPAALGVEARLAAWVALVLGLILAVLTFLAVKIVP